MVFDSRICRRNGRSNSRRERAGSTPTAQPARSRQAIPINSRSRRFGTRGKSPRANARLHVYGNPNTSTCGTCVDNAVNRFRDDCVGSGAPDSSGFRLSDRRCYRAHRDCRGKHRSDIHALTGREKR